MTEVASAVRLPSPSPEPETKPETTEQLRKRDRSPYDAGPSKRSRFGDDHEERDEKPRRERENGRAFDNGRKPTVNDLPEDDARLKMFEKKFSKERKPDIDDSQT